MSFQELESGGPSPGRGANGKQDQSQSAAAGVFQITTAVSTFERLVNTLGTRKDTPQLRERLHKTRLHIGRLVKDASAKLKQASETDQQSEVSLSVDCIAICLPLLLSIIVVFLLAYGLPFIDDEEPPLTPTLHAEQYVKICYQF